MQTKITPQQALDATNRKQYVDKDVLDTWPQTTGQLEYFKLNKYVTAKDLDAEYESRGLLPAPFALCEADSISHDTFDEKKYVATQWKDKDGKFCFAVFGGWGGGRRVRGRRRERGWDDRWWFCAVRKEPFNKPKPALIEGDKDNEGLKNRLKEYEINTNGCWEWKGTISKGYGVMKVHSRSIRVHRLMYEMFIGNIPEGMVLDHVCQNKQCVNPEHLEIVTLGENTLRGNSPTARNARKTHCSEGHPLSGDNVVIKDGGRRRCKMCLSKKI